MAVRRPLYNDSGDLREMSDAMIDDIIQFCIFKHQTAGGVILSVDSSNVGNLTSIQDTRLKAGEAANSSSSFPPESTTGEPEVVTVNFNRITQQVNAGSNNLTPDTNNNRYPVYYDGSGNIRAMDADDMKDTFIHPAIDQLVSGSTTTKQAGTYQISTSTSLTGNTLISSTPVFVDTRADTSAYSAGSIPETLDQPTTITNYYLHRIDGSNTTYTSPVFIEGSNNLQEFATATFETLLSELIRYTAVSSTDGYKITYSYSSGTNRGTGMANTKLSGSGNRQTRFVNTNDYRAQEFPDGTPTTIDTYFLKINKA